MRYRRGAAKIDRHPARVSCSLPDAMRAMCNIALETKRNIAVPDGTVVASSLAERSDRRRAMSISGIGSYAAQSINPWASSAKTATASASGDTSAAPQSNSGGVQKTDFTQMTRQQLFDWINSKISSGEMTFDESSTFVSMTLSFRADGTSTGLDDTQKVDFMQSVRNGMARAQNTNDSDLFTRLQTALNTMQRYQGEVRGVNITA
ncbi:hypothetical protein NML43_24065 [Rhodopseudomonas palustris]|uniref:hypothetical protein n=1 Tax=Rhodopseudomonas palustris TaxID=1076 RepID=UPI0020CFC63E|nr:hypothetical protein [Rhodopseudomonas palustris]MCP9630180.1 hypothetical protein [Rhodopseudomonas palustris]